ncbi:leucine-rich repeat-containing protein 56 [Cimex lectularius]|uniref:Uncharacterized protein n=1 Tax=Cimex lectularius TaxID=79782 RepID=A0A8I6RYA3_CIMLE|nr:leucine-rich repeat-containing protein 56 [Cimex lectularius]XP_014253538.1 leucine-rich repeat-containing protein 56 [Cimex lectularius]
MSPFTENSDQGFEPDENESKLMIREGSGHLDIIDLLTQVADTYDLQSVLYIKLKIMTKDLPLHNLNLYLPGLKELDLDNSNINSLRELGAELGGLQVLRINKCRLESLDGILSFKNLSEFSASNNYITNIGLVGQLEHLRYFDISRNFIQDWKQLSFLKTCDRLEHLRFEGNPGSKFTSYQAEVKKMLPNLVTLDGITLDPQDNTTNEENNLENSSFNPTIESEKRERKYTLTPDICGNLAKALIQSKKQSHSKDGGDEKAASSNQNVGANGLLLAAEHWKKTFQEFLKNRSNSPT